jgi:aspartate 1-decarboxylase
MQIQVSKIHRVKVTGADLNYIGSITIDESLLKLQYNWGESRYRKHQERFETYAIKGEKFWHITLNGPAARKVQKTISLLLFLMRQWNLKPLKHSNHGLFSQMKTTTH